MCWNHCFYCVECISPRVCLSRRRSRIREISIQKLCSKIWCSKFKKTWNGLQKWAKIHSKSMQKSIQKILWFLGGFWSGFWYPWDSLKGILQETSWKGHHPEQHPTAKKVKCEGEVRRSCAARACEAQHARGAGGEPPARSGSRLPAAIFPLRASGKLGAFEKECAYGNLQGLFGFGCRKNESHTKNNVFQHWIKGPQVGVQQSNF